MYRTARSKGKPEQGYQLPLTPREFFAAGVVATNEWTRKTHGKDFDRLAAEGARGRAQGNWTAARPRFPISTASSSSRRCCTITMEGFFADPIYGGNRNKAAGAWSAIPGLPAIYADLIDEYRNKRYVVEPQSIADFS